MAATAATRQRRRWPTTTTWSSLVGRTCSTPTGTGSASSRSTPTNRSTSDVDIVPYDSFAQPESDHQQIAVLVANSHARRVGMYPRNFNPDLIDDAHHLGVDG